MPHGDLSIFTRGARLLRDLKQLQRGQNYRMSAQMLSDVTVPADPLDNQTPEYLANWFHVRMPFYCELHHDLVGNFWEIRRPQQKAAPRAE